MLFDLKHETAGLNRRKNETFQEYVERLVVHDKLGKSRDYSIPEFPPSQMAKINEKIKTHENTYYFSYSTGDRNMTRQKMREVMREPSKTTEMLLGYDGETVQNLKLRGTVKKEKG